MGGSNPTWRTCPEDLTQLFSPPGLLRCTKIKLNINSKVFRSYWLKKINVFLFLASFLGPCGLTTSLAMRRITPFTHFCTSTSATKLWARQAAWQWWVPAGTCLRRAAASWSSTCRSVRLWVRPRPARPTAPWSALDYEPVMLQAGPKQTERPPVLYTGVNQL